MSPRIDRPSHRGRMLLWVPALIALLIAGSSAALAAGTFTDDDGNVHEGNIEAIAAKGITRGCNPPANDHFCPSDLVTRGSMAAFIVRSLGLTDDGGKDWFSDDDGHLFENDINRLAAAGITKGCNPPNGDRYCPDRPVIRAEMAAFLGRAFGYQQGAGNDYFHDDDGSVFEADIDRLAAAGVTKGCSPPPDSRFCPNDSVRRDTMASFLARALGLDPIEVTSQVPYLFGPHIGGAGEWDILDQKFTGAHFSPTSPGKALEILNDAQADGKSVILLLARSGSHYQNPDGTFSLEMWKAAIDQFAGFDFAPFIEDGTFLAHYLVSEPSSKNSWGGEVITAPVLDEMARYSKQYWPNLVTVVREHPTDLIAHAGGKNVPIPGWQWSYLDTAWARYSADKGAIGQFIAEEVGAAKAQDLGLMFGMNVLDGGDGSSGVFGDSGWTMSVQELMDYGPKLINEAYGCALLMWHYRHGDTGYFDRPEIDQAMTNLVQVAAGRATYSCVAP